MKKHTFTLLLGWLLLLASNLMAQHKEGRFNLKEGDWFEVEAEQNDCDGGITNCLLRYQLKKQLPNNNQQYQITLEHYKILKHFDSDNYGYDSYYPTFEDNKTNADSKNQFSMEVTSNGSIVGFDPLKSNNNSTILLASISPSDGTYSNAFYSLNKPDSLMINRLSNILMLSHSTTNGIQFSEVNKIPLIINQSDIQLHITNASFRLPANAIIKGMLNDQINQEITVNLNGENAESNFPETRFKTTSEGSFNCPIFLKRPVHLKIQIGNKTLTTFMEAGDTLNITAIGHQVREIQEHFYTETKPNEYYSADLKKSDYFTGSAAYNTMLSNELDQYRYGFFYEDNINILVEKEKETTRAVNQLIDSYRGKASNNCIEYFQYDFKYFLAAYKLYCNAIQGTSFTTIQGNRYHLLKIDYPNDFFLAVDTLPILMNPFEWNSSYQSFIHKAQVFKQYRLGRSVRKNPSQNFMENYYFSVASLKGYPLYLQIVYYIDQELRKGSDINIVQPYYYNFLKNCADPALTEPLKKVYETAELLKKGNRFPVSTFALKDSSIFNLAAYKGRPICLILLNDLISDFKSYKEEILKFNNENVHFVIASLPGRVWMEGNIDSIVQKTPNLTYIELADKTIQSKLLLNRNKVFMIDKWFRIVENNAEDPMTHKYKGTISQFEKSLRNTIEAKRYSKAEQSAMLKNAGWSLGSILFTVLVGFGIYRVRIRRIKQQEEAKRRIKELEIKAIRSQMNPHFIFNALNSIQSLINGNQFKEANIYLSKFAVLLRGVLNNSEKGMVSLSDELKAVELYCQLEQLRFDFNFDISIAEDVNGDLIEIPGMIIQPLAENAVVHGISGKGDQGKLGIQVIRQKEHICIEVSDNGVGLSSKENDSLSQKGFGLKLVEERINILNLEGKEARLTVRNIGNSQGTLATLIIPID